MSNEHLKLVPTPEPAKDPLIGQVLDGRYEIEGVLGEGGMGIVYKAKHVTLGKKLAIKVLKAEVSKDQEIVQRFRQEAQSATAIGNHHIIDISDFGVLSDGSTYFVMEFLDGQSLTRAIEPGKPLKATRTIHIAKQLCRALGAAHDVGIVHRDLKPDNIYLIKRGGDSDFVKVLDFGIAKVGGAKSKLTQVGQVFGTPHYMSPEQCAGTAVDKRTDVYALGVIMYEMASSRVPFDADNLMGILTKHLYEEPVKPHELPPPVDVPPALEAVIMKCLAKKADTRYQSMQEVLSDLELVEQGLTPSAVVEGVKRATNAGRNTSNSQGSMSRETGGVSALTMDVGEVAIPKRNTGLIVGGAVALLLAIGGGIFAMSGNDEQPAVVTNDPAQGNGTPVGQGNSQQPVTPTNNQAATENKPEEKGEDTPPPPPPEPTVKVSIKSTPASVDIYADGALIGHTPFELPRPKQGEPTLKLTLKADGYKDLPLSISSFSQTELNVELDKERRRPGAGNNARPTEPTRPQQPQQPQPPAQQEERPRRPSHSSGEVLDPWG